MTLDLTDDEADLLRYLVMIGSMVCAGKVVNHVVVEAVLDANALPGEARSGVWAKVMGEEILAAIADDEVELPTAGTA